MVTEGMIGLGLNFFVSYSSSCSSFASSFTCNDGYNRIDRLRAQSFIYRSHSWMD